MHRFLQTAVCCAVACLLARGAAADGLVTRYDLYSKGLTVGHVTTSRSLEHREDGDYVRCSVDTRVDVGLVLISVHKASREDVVLGPDGAVDYMRHTEEDGHTVDVKGERRGDVFHFAIVEDGVARTWDVPRADYDVTSMDSFELQVAEGESLTRRVLLMGEMQLVNRTFRCGARQRVKASGDEMDCRVVDVTDPLKEMRRWVKADDLGMLIVRQDGKDKAGSYSMRLRSIDAQPDVAALP